MITLNSGCISLETALTPGFLPAARAVHALLEGTVSADDVDHIVELALFVSRPYMQAELLADLSDKLAEDGFEQVSAILDHTSFGMRGALDGRG